MHQGERAHPGRRQQKAKSRPAGSACGRRPEHPPDCRGFRSKKRNAFQLCMKQGIVGNKRFPGEEVSSHLSAPRWPPVSKNNLMSRAEERLLSAYTLIFLLLWLTFVNWTVIFKCEPNNGGGGVCVFCRLALVMPFIVGIMSGGGRMEGKAFQRCCLSLN